MMVRHKTNPGRARYSKRMSNIVASNPSLVVFCGSVNDVSYPVAQVAAHAVSYWKTIHKALPQAQIIVIGPIRMGSQWNTKPLSDALQGAATRSGFPRAIALENCARMTPSQRP